MASRAQLGAATGLSRATISDITSELLASGLIVSVRSRSAASSRAGRTPEALTLNPAAGLMIGLEFGHAKVTVVASNAAHHIVGSARQNYPKTAEWGERMRIAGELIHTVIPTGSSPSPLVAIGIGVPGSIAQRPTVLAEIDQYFTTRYGVPLRLDNNARLAGLAEFHWGAAQAMHDVAYLRLSNGVGGVLILDDKIRRGNGGTAGEFGHVCLDPAGPICRCANRGCLECYVGVETVLANAAQPSVEELTAALDRGDARALAVVADAGARIGLVLANACNVLNLSSVVLGGDLASTGDHLVRAVRQTMARHLHNDAPDSLQIRTASLGELDGALGGVALILEDLTIALSGHRTSTHLARTALPTA